MTQLVKETDNEIVTVDDWGMRTRYFDNIDGVGVQTTQDVEPILEANKALFVSGDPGVVPSGASRKVADIPFSVYMLWIEKYGVDALNPDHAGAVRRLLNSSEWLYLRTAPGRL